MVQQQFQIINHGFLQTQKHQRKKRSFILQLHLLSFKDHGSRSTNMFALIHVTIWLICQNHKYFVNINSFALKWFYYFQFQWSFLKWSLNRCWNKVESKKTALASTVTIKLEKKQHAVSTIAGYIVHGHPQIRLHHQWVCIRFLIF